jgi:hypothetical protein
MFKMGLHDPFENLKHKLWPKERLGVKLPIWFSTTKSQESPWFPCVKVVCYIPLKIFQQGLQLCLRPHLNQRSAHKVMGIQIHGNPNSENFETPNLGVPWQNNIWLLAPWPSIKNTIRGKVVASPKFGLWWVLWVHVCLWLVYAPKVLQLRINQLVVWFVQLRVNNWIAYDYS